MLTIYEAEQNIAHLLNTNSIALNLLATEDPIQFNTIASANPYQIDLFYIKSVLVSLGWNGNDDVFDKIETISAYKTPIDKQFNLLHNEKDIIGHITSSDIHDGQNYIIDLTNIPDQFDIIVGSVIYKKWQDNNLQKRIDTIIAEIKENKWFVSMECLFRDFDYATLKDGVQKIVARNENTAFLTKYLRAYGGPGEFKGEKIGRLLRNFSFSGKGLVDNPANKRSVILNYSEFSEENTAAKEHMMADTVSNEKYQEILDKLAKAEKSAQESADKAKAKEMADLQSKIDALTKELDSVSVAKTELDKNFAQTQNELSVTKEAGKNKDEQIVALTKERDELNVKVKAAEELQAKITIEKVKADRLIKLAKREVATDRAQALVEKFLNVSEEMFDEVVNSFAEKKEQTVAKKVPDLEDYEMDEDLSLSVASDTKEAQELRAKASAWFASTITEKGEK